MLADRVVVMSAGPGSRIVSDVEINLPRPRDVSQLATTDEFMRLYRQIWDMLGKEVEKSYVNQ